MGAQYWVVSTRGLYCQRCVGAIPSSVHNGAALPRVQGQHCTGLCSPGHSAAQGVGGCNIRVHLLGSSSTQNEEGAVLGFVPQVVAVPSVGEGEEHTVLGFVHQREAFSRG